MRPGPLPWRADSDSEALRLNWGPPSGFSDSGLAQPSATPQETVLPSPSGIDIEYLNTGCVHLSLLILRVGAGQTQMCLRILRRSQCHKAGWLRLLFRQDNSPEATLHPTSCTGASGLVTRGSDIRRMLEGGGSAFE